MTPLVMIIGAVAAIFHLLLGFCVLMRCQIHHPNTVERWIGISGWRWTSAWLLWPLAAPLIVWRDRKSIS